MNNIKLQNLPPYGKLFVGITTVLMLCICLWSVFIFYVDKGLIEEGTVPDYMKTEYTEDYHEELLDEAEAIIEDTLAELAPDWDSDFVEDSATIIDPEDLAEKFEERDPAVESSVADDLDDSGQTGWKKHLRHNVGLAHTHINGQTLLFFVLGFLFIFSSARPKIKNILLWSFGIVIVCHAVGLSGEGFHWFFDDLLAVSGVGLLILIPYMSFLIIVDLFKNPENNV